MTAEQILDKKTVEDFNNMIEYVYNDRFEKFFEYMLSGTTNFEDVFSAYKICRDALVDNLTENLYFFSSGCTFESYNLITKYGEPITEKSDRDDVFNALNKDFEDRRQKLDMIFLQYAKAFVGKLDFSIKKFPKNTTEKEKDILNHLSSNFHIQRELSPNGKLPLFGKNGTKRLINALYDYAPDYKDFQAFNFINLYIETNLPAATLQNYCREVKKDMPAKNNNTQEAGNDNGL
jgi:hypothetical protein